VRIEASSTPLTALQRGTTWLRSAPIEGLTKKLTDSIWIFDIPAFWIGFVNASLALKPICGPYHRFSSRQLFVGEIESVRNKGIRDADVVDQVDELNGVDDA